MNVSSKTARVSIAGSNNYLGVAEVSDISSSYPPSLTIYSVKSTIHRLQNIGGPCSSLGRSLVPFNLGFFASAPASAFRWGEPGPLVYKIIPPAAVPSSLNYRIPYGEIFASSYRGNLQIACSPLSASECLVISGNDEIQKIMKPDNSQHFGLSTAVSPNGTTIAIISATQSSFIEILLFSNQRAKIATFKLPHEPPLRPRSKAPFLYFKDEKHLLAVFYDIGLAITYKDTINGWILDQSVNMQVTSICPILDQYYATLTKEGRVQILDKSFAVKYEEIVPRVIHDSVFTDITAGNDWFAVLEDSLSKRKLHVYSMRSSGFFRPLFVIASIGLIGLVIKFAKSRIELQLLFSHAYRRRDGMKEV